MSDKSLDIPDWMIIDSFRYALGRKTYQVSTTANWLVKHWREINEFTQNMIRVELNMAFERDDEARAEGRKYKPLGMDCDRACWEKVRGLWRERV